MPTQKLKSFSAGGLHLDDSKISSQNPIQALALPAQVAIPLAQHIGAPAVPMVKPGDLVKTGQLIAQRQGLISANIHSSVTGKILKIEPVMDHSGFKTPAIIIQSEPDQWLEGIKTDNRLDTEIRLNRQEIIDRIAEAGIVGLGGATFPSHAKLNIPANKKIEYLIINGAECEPYLTSDHRLMLEKTNEIIVGVRILLKALEINKALIGVESNKPDAITALKNAAQNIPEIEVQPLKTFYPQGGERQIIKALLNREIPPPPEGLPMDVGCVVFNVATTFAVYEAVQKNKPLIERVVTISGRLVTKPGNFLTRIGTPLRQLIDAAGGLPEDTGKIVSGGPMMGKAVITADIPVTKGMGGVVLFSKKDSIRKPIQPCIRCAKCVQACPLGLEPYLLMVLVQKGLLDRAEESKVLNCCECSCCTFVCPASRPLLDYLRLGRIEVLKRRRARKAKTA